MVSRDDEVNRGVRLPTGGRASRISGTREHRVVPVRRPWSMRWSPTALGSTLAVAVGCAVVMEPDEPTHSPEDVVSVEAEDIVPDARDGAPPPPVSAADRWTPCADLLGDATGLVRADLVALCGATGHDGSCVGFACARTPPREALECLLEAGHAERVIALQRAEGPATRAFAREAMTRTDAWTERSLREALHDRAMVEQCEGCICSVEVQSSVGLEQALRHSDRAMARPLLAAWAGGDPQTDELVSALERRPAERWISDARLVEWSTDPDQEERLRVAAAFALAHRGDDVGRAVLETGAHSADARTRALAVGGFDALDDADAWDRWAPLTRDGHYEVRMAMMRLGARLRLQDAAKVIDREGNEMAAVLLPPRLFRSRAPKAICAHRFANAEARDRLEDALGRLSRAERCEALRRAEDDCADEYDPPGSLAAAAAPRRAAECGMPMPEPSGGRWPSCERTRRAQEAERALELERRAREAERRARAAAGAD